jgi:hypothetical protein
MNLTYKGSIAEHNMNFATQTDVVINENTELFNVISIYVPMSVASANIVDFDPAWVSAAKPAVISCTVKNYTKYMKGRLLDQWQDVFCQDTNFDVTLYLIIFLDDASTADMWNIDDVSIKFAPITAAFNKLHFISFVKTLFDPTYEGKPVLVPATEGTKALAQIRLDNNTEDDVTIPAGEHIHADASGKNWVITTGSEIVLGADETVDVAAVADTVGSVALEADTDFDFLGIRAYVVSVQQGTNATDEHEVPSRFYDHALALAYMCKLDLKLSYFINTIKVSYVNDKPNPEDTCWIRYKSSAEEKEVMLSVKDDNRARYYWGALFLMNCVKNTWTLIHSEPVNIIPLIFAAWFAARNASGNFVGNKLSLLRLKGTRIKPCGFPSWLNSEVNQNDSEGIELLQAKNVGFLRTIADNTVQECCVDSARSIDGMPVSAHMIAKWVDYMSAQDCAKFVTDSGTVTDPVLTNEDAYKKIQSITMGKLGLFTSTKRINNIQMKFPSISVAKVGSRELKAARSWSAKYTDDLDTVTVTGGLIVE